jgi:hypothetical protein
MLAGIIVDVMYLMNEVCHMVDDGGSLLVRGSTE